MLPHLRRARTRDTCQIWLIIEWVFQLRRWWEATMPTRTSRPLSMAKNCRAHTFLSTSKSGSKCSPWLPHWQLLSSLGSQRTKDVSWERVGGHLMVWNSDAVPLSSSKTGVQNAREKFSRVQNFSCLNFCGFYFRVSVMGCKNRENLDLAKISRYTVADEGSWGETPYIDAILYALSNCHLEHSKEPVQHYVHYL